MSKLISQPSTLICVLSEHPPCPRKTVKTSSFYIVFHTERSWRAKRAEDTMIARRRQMKEMKESHAVCLVEAEKSAFILSELYPEYIWLASGGLGEVQPDKFRPLRGYRVIMFPDTDPDGIAYKRWYDAVQFVMQQPFWENSPPIYVSSLLEIHATPEQKQRKIDLVDFLFPNLNP